MDRAATLKAKLDEFAASENKAIKPTEKKRQIRRLETKIRETEEEARLPSWIGHAGPSPSLVGNDFYRDMIEKLRLRVKPMQKKQEEADDLHCLHLGYLDDHQKSRAAVSSDGLGTSSSSSSSSSASTSSTTTTSSSTTTTTTTNNNNNNNNNNTTDATMMLPSSASSLPPALPSIACFSLQNNYDSLSCTSTSRDGVQLVGGYSDGIIRVWRLDGETHLGETYGFTPSKEDSPLATTTGLAESAANLVGHTMGVTSCTFSPDNEWLLSSSEDSTMRMWHLKSKATVSAYRSSADSLHPVWDVAWSPMGYYFASASHDRTASLWSPERSSPVRRFVGHTSDVETIAFHPNATMVATGSLDRTVRLWDLRVGSCVRLFSAASGAAASGGVTSLTFSPNGEYLVSGGESDHLTVWSLPASKVIKRLGWKSTTSKCTVRSLAYSKDGTVLASSTTDRCVRLWDAGSFHVVNDESAGRRHDGVLASVIATKTTDVYDLQFTERNLLVASGCTREKRVLM